MFLTSHYLSPIINSYLLSSFLQILNFRITAWKNGSINIETTDKYSQICQAEDISSSLYFSALVFKL